ncbi:MAG: hypothetical protein IPJ77_11080 [Planctomycetes bacterium]|nr:hypothetical protein [Planctomycetota bacterium]
MNAPIHTSWSRPSVVLLVAVATLATAFAFQQPAGPARSAQYTARCRNVPACPWPAEPPSSATNLTAVEGPGTNDFHEDLSGAYWNPAQQALWLCRNGGSGGSKIWKLVSSGPSTFQVATVAGQRAEWTGFGDCEAITLATLAEPSTLFTIEEGSNSIQEWDLSLPSAVLRRTWNLSAFVPAYAGGLGLEALTFVPDAALVAGGFVGANGQPRVSTQGMGSLAFVGHQNGGRIYVFDLNRATGAFQFVGAYRTSDPETAELFFDPSLGVLFAWHGDGRNDLEVLELGSTVVGSERQLDRRLTYDFPGTENVEGFALQWSPAGCPGTRGAFVTTDDGGAIALRWFRQFPCGF